MIVKEGTLPPALFVATRDPPGVVEADAFVPDGLFDNVLFVVWARRLLLHLCTVSPRCLCTSLRLILPCSLDSGGLGLRGLGDALCTTLAGARNGVPCRSAFEARVFEEAAIMATKSVR